MCSSSTSISQIPGARGGQPGRIGHSPPGQGLPAHPASSERRHLRGPETGGTACSRHSGEGTKAPVLRQRSQRWHRQHRAHTCPAQLRPGALNTRQPAETHRSRGSQLQLPLQVPFCSPLPLQSLRFPPQLKVEVAVDLFLLRASRQRGGGFAPAPFHPGVQREPVSHDSSHPPPTCARDVSPHKGFKSSKLSGLSQARDAVPCRSSTALFPLHRLTV